MYNNIMPETPETLTTERVVCPACKRGVNVRDGIVADHNGRGPSYGRGRCPMSGKSPSVCTGRGWR